MMTINYIISLPLLIGATMGAVPKLNGRCYYQPGDINLAIFAPLSNKGSEEFCSDKLRANSRPQYIEASKYALSEVNNNNDIIPNITLGYVIMDSCIRDLVALGRSLSLVPDYIVENGTCSDDGSPFNVAGKSNENTSHETFMGL